MNLTIIVLLLSTLGCVQPMEMKALKRIKRKMDVKTQDKRFQTKSVEPQDSNDSTPLASTAPVAKAANGTLPDLAARPLISKNTFMAKLGSIGKSKNHLTHYKSRHSTHVLHPAGLVAKLISPTHSMHSSCQGLSTVASVAQLMNVGNMMMFKLGLDAMPPHMPHMITMQNSPHVYEKENFLSRRNRPEDTYAFSALKGPNRIFLYWGTSQRFSDLVNENILPPHTIIYQPAPLAAEEPTELMEAMASAVGSLLASGGDDFGSKKEIEIEFICPLHGNKKPGPHINGPNDDEVQVCSCRSTEKASEDKKKVEK